MPIYWQEQPLPLLLQDVPQVKLLGQQALLRVWQQEQVQLWVRQAEVLFEGPLEQAEELFEEQQEQKRQLSLRLKPECFSSPQSFWAVQQLPPGAAAPAPEAEGAFNTSSIISSMMLSS